MKKIITLFSFFIVLINFSVSQVNEIKDYPLKDYVAPDIKYQLLNLGTNMDLMGYQLETDNGNSNKNSFNGNLDLNYYLYQNTSRFQGISDASFQTLYQYVKEEFYTDDNSYIQKNSSLSVGLDYFGQNRRYFDSSVFVGLNGFVILNNTQRNNENNYNIQQYNFAINPYLSVGKGRIQPVQSARKAMDILLSLQKYNRLAFLPDTLMIDSLAYVANSIIYKRFYDIRFKDIYQLEQLDHAIQNMNLVDTADIVYFANLNDIWNFTQNFKRGSGTRYEGGIIPAFHYYYDNYDSENSQNSSIHNQKWYGLFGFFSFNRMRPVSYAWQSDLMLDITFGITANDEEEDRSGGSIDTYETNFKGMLNASWQFGYYPNTRTYLGLTPFAATSFVSDTEFADSEFGLNTGLIFNTYYYVSPRLRLSFFAQVFYTDNFDRYIPSPFWNNPAYTSNNLEALQATNDVVTNPIDAYYARNSIQYSFSFALRYAIF